MGVGGTDFNPHSVEGLLGGSVAGPLAFLQIQAYWRMIYEAGRFGSASGAPSSKFGDRPCLVAPEGTQTYEEVAHEAVLIGMALRESGLESGSRVAVMMRNRPEYFTLLLGCAMAESGDHAVEPTDRSRENWQRYSRILSSGPSSRSRTLSGLADVGACRAAIAPELRRRGRTSGGRRLGDI